MSNRRKFLKNITAGAAGLTMAGSAISMPARNYKRIIGANDRINVAIAGLGRRLFAYVAPIAAKEANVELVYLCDVMEKQRTKGLEQFSKALDYVPKTENDIRKVIEDPNVDALINATPDHWHAPGSIMAMKEGKNVYVEKPCSHNMYENELIVAAAKKFGKVVQMGNQQRSADHTIHIIKDIHNGVIGTPYKAIAIYSMARGKVPLQKKSAAPDGLDWELFQGPAPRRDYTIDTWDYNWHWYGWDYGTAEAGNNATHELDIARWALQVDFPLRVDVEAEKRHYLSDGWEMYDTMEATFRFSEDKIIQWDGKSRNGYDTYNSGGRGTLIYGSDGTVFVNRGRYDLYDRHGKKVRSDKSGSDEAGTALGGGGGMTTLHVINFFEAIRGKEELRAPIEDASISNAMVHYMNVAYRIGRGFDIDDKTGRMYDREAMKLWSREYESGWEPKL